MSHTDIPMTAYSPDDSSDIAVCLMIFCLLYVPCAAALATIHKESGSWKWTAFEAFFQLATAWIVTFVAYHLLSIL